ncbi:p2X purinoceptor 4 [Trichonephila clavipes]|nr:p2X purinoceptor 4 [Trichonephila clavipes]
MARLGGIILVSRTDLHVQSVTMTGHIYRDVILEQLVSFFQGAIGAEFLFMDDNARPHLANIVDECLQLENITHMNWPAYSPNLNPIEHVKNNKPLLAATKKFTVLIKNFVDFPKFKIRRRNIPNFKDPNYLKRCNYHPVNNPLCPIFVLEDIVSGNYDEMAVKGATVAIIIDWQCNFDLSESKCYPTYSFRRLDENSLISPGLNFRYAHFYGDSERTLYKAYGIKFIVMAQGRGGKFNIVPLLLNIGSGLGLLAVATILCDVVVLYILKKKDLYKSVKFQSVLEDSTNVREEQSWIH